MFSRPLSGAERCFEAPLLECWTPKGSARVRPNTPQCHALAARPGARYPLGSHPDVDAQLARRLAAPTPRRWRLAGVILPAERAAGVRGELRCPPFLSFRGTAPSRENGPALGDEPGPAPGRQEVLRFGESARARSLWSTSYALRSWRSRAQTVR